MTYFYKIGFLRRFFLPLLNKYRFDFTMTHPWNKEVRIYLNSFQHKGYWWHRKNREKDTMLLFTKIINTGNNVVEVGGHIGFITSFFASLVGENGRIFVFEPGITN